RTHEETGGEGEQREDEPGRLVDAGEELFGHDRRERSVQIEVVPLEHRSQTRREDDAPVCLINAGSVGWQSSCGHLLAPLVLVLSDSALRYRFFATCRNRPRALEYFTYGIREESPVRPRGQPCRPPVNFWTRGCRHAPRGLHGHVWVKVPAPSPLSALDVRSRANRRWATRLSCWLYAGPAPRAGGCTRCTVGALAG